jgi:hypothetical protein
MTTMYRLSYGCGGVCDVGPSLKVAKQAYRAQLEADRRLNQFSGVTLERWVGDDAPDGWATVHVRD